MSNPKSAAVGDMTFSTPVPQDDKDKEQDKKNDRQFEKDKTMVQSEAFKWYGNHIDLAVDKFSNVSEMELDIDDAKLAQQLRVNRQVVAALRSIKAEAETLEEAHGDGE